jgi:hypothetical protein
MSQKISGTRSTNVPVMARLSGEKRVRVVETTPICSTKK